MLLMLLELRDAFRERKQLLFLCFFIVFFTFMAIFFNKAKFVFSTKLTLPLQLDLQIASDKFKAGDEIRSVWKVKTQSESSPEQTTSAIVTEDQSSFTDLGARKIKLNATFRESVAGGVSVAAFKDYRGGGIDGNPPKTLIVREGEYIDGWHVSKILVGRVELIKGDKKMNLIMFQAVEALKVD